MLRGPHGQQRSDDKAGARDERSDRGVPPGKLLLDEADGPEALHSTPAVGLGHVETGEPVLGRLAHDVSGELIGFVVRGGDRTDLSAGELVRQLDEILLGLAAGDHHPPGGRGGGRSIVALAARRATIAASLLFETRVECYAALD